MITEPYTIRVPPAHRRLHKAIADRLRIDPPFEETLLAALKGAITATSQFEALSRRLEAVESEVRALLQGWQPAPHGAPTTAERTAKEVTSPDAAPPGKRLSPGRELAEELIPTS